MNKPYKNNSPSISKILQKTTSLIKTVFIGFLNQFAKSNVANSFRYNYICKILNLFSIFNIKSQISLNRSD